MEDNSELYQYEINLGLLTPEDAKILADVIDVDIELNSQVIKRQITQIGNQFLLKYTSKDAKKLRAAVNNMFDNMILVLETIKNLK